MRIRQILSFLLVALLFAACNNTGNPVATDTSPPTAPVWIKIVPADSQVNLAWQANPEPDVHHYVLRWGKAADNLIELADVPNTQTEHVLGGLSNQTTYHFALSAVDEHGNTSKQSEVVSATPEALTQPPASPPPVAGDFTVSALETIEIQKGQGKQLLFVLARNSFADEIALRLKNPPAGLSSDLPKSTFGDQIVAALSVTGAAVGQYLLEFEASAGVKAKTIQVKLEVTPTPPAPVTQITSVQLEGFGNSKQVRQGHGNVILKVQGQHLSGISTAKLQTNFDGGSSTLPVSILSKSDTTATLEVAVKHGVFSGLYDLTVANGNVAQKPNAVIVTSIVAAPTGSDGSGKGTPDAPFRSLTKAVSVAESSDLILLKPGEYNTANGEVLPLDVSGKTIQGAGSDNSIISGTGSASHCLVVAGAALETRLSDLRVRNCTESGLKLESGKTILNRVWSTDNQGNGLSLTGSSEVKVLGGLFTSNSHHGISAVGNAKVNLENEISTSILNNGDAGLYLITNAKLTGRALTISGNKHGLWMFGPGTGATLEDSSIQQSSDAGVLIDNNQYINLTRVQITKGNTHGIRVKGNTQLLQLTDSTLEDNAGDGINVNVEADEIAVLDLEKAKIVKNGQSGIEFRSANKTSKLAMKASLIAQNASHGLYVAGQPAGINLDSVGGINLFDDNAKTQLVDARDANSGTIKAQETLFRSAAGVSFNPSGIKNGPDSQLPRWQIINLGNSIDFGF